MSSAASKMLQEAPGISKPVLDRLGFWVLRGCARILQCQLSRSNLKLMKSPTLRRRANQPYTAFASSVTTCFALRRKILTPSSVQIAIRASFRTSAVNSRRVES